MRTDMPPTLRQRRREELTEDVLLVARQHVEEQGPANLSLRAVSRQIGIAPSALYRYFSSRDELLTALIARTFIEIAQLLETSVNSALTEHPDDLIAAWVDTTVDYRDWALTHRGEFGLVYGTPVPGYTAPETATREVGRQSGAPLFRIVLRALEAGEANVEAFDQQGHRMSGDMQTSMAHEAGARGLDLPSVRAAGLITTAYGAWATLQGLITMELFGHLPATHPHAEEFFRAESALVAHRLIRHPPNMMTKTGMRQDRAPLA